MIVTKEVIQLVEKIEKSPSIDSYLKALILLLQDNCSSYHNSREATSYPCSTPAKSASYPLIDGFALGFDPLHESHQLLQHWDEYGFVVARNIVAEPLCLAVVSKIKSIMQGCDMNLQDESSWLKDSNHTAILSRGFFELYHDDVLAQVRQSIRLYVYHTLLWKTPYLWTTFDRCGLKIPQGLEAQGLPLHVDQNPLVHPHFTTIQGVLALEDCPVERGTFVVVPGSIDSFPQYSGFIAQGYRGEYVGLPPESELFKLLDSKKQFIPLKKGNMVSWDSRLTHANSSNVSSQNRYVFYLSSGVAREDSPQLIEMRRDAFTTGLGQNSRDAYLHASKKPRFTNQAFLQKLRQPEQLTTLGQCLYGFKKYKDIQ